MQKSSIQIIINAMGYNMSENLYKLTQVNECKDLSWHDRRIIQEIAPYAVYVVDSKVLVAFFDDLHKRTNVDVQCKVWNSQIPVIISDEGNIVKIYNGRSVDLSKLREHNAVRLSEMQEFNITDCDESNLFSYWNITNQNAMREFEAGMSKKRLNDYLIEHLQYIITQLKEKYQVGFANKLVLRILFIRYLIDRGICIGYEGLNDDVAQSQKKFLQILQDAKSLLGLFKYLKLKFNGNLFEYDEKEETERLNDAVLNLLHDFAAGNVEITTGQLCLFPYYDFNIIPIELISNIYEILLGKEKQDKDKAFYTPEYLVDYMVGRTVDHYLESNDECKILDPSCGSGIFLVKSLKSILEKNSLLDGYIQDKQKLNALVNDNIYGVDYNEEAVDVTIFSLYITLFDYQDPKNLADFRLPLLKGKNIIYGDFFNDDNLTSIRKQTFLFIIGNPPWGKVDQQLYKDYCKKKKVILPDNEICIAFMLKIREFTNERTMCNLIVPSKILYKGKKPSLDFRKILLTEAEINQVLELSSVRKQIFKGAIAPSSVISFSFRKHDTEHKLEYISLKPNKYFSMFNIIVIEADDVKYVEQSRLLANDWLWKTLVYGSYWDYDLIATMKQKYSTVQQIEKECDLLSGKGIQDHLGDERDSSHLVGRELICSDDCIEHFRLNADEIVIFDKNKIHRPRNKELFEPPYVFFKKGVDCKDYTIRAVYTDERLVYREAVNCIKGKSENSSVLKNLAGLLNSSLFAYFNLMLGSSVGIEREQIFLKELEMFPYAYSNELVQLVDETQKKATSGDDITENIKQINQCVLRMFNVEDNYFIDYALKIQIPLLSGNYESTVCSEDTLRMYAKVFCLNWRDRLERNGIFMSINIYPCIHDKFAAFEVTISDNNEKSSIQFVKNADDNLQLMTKFMIYKINDLFYQVKNIAEFGENSFVIIKTVDTKNWHPSMALRDSYDILNAILLDEGDCK